MDGIAIAPEVYHGGEGISLGLARGPVVMFRGENLAAEGMGIGAVAARDGHATYFGRAWTGNGLERTFDLDTRMAWSYRGRPSAVLSRSIEAAVGVYKRMPCLQPIAVRSFLPLRRAFGIDPVFETAPSAGRVTVSLECREGRAAVRAGIEPPSRPGTTVCLLNELSADVFSASLRDGRIGPPPPAWEPLTDGGASPLLYDPVRDLCFGLAVDAVPDGVPWRLFWGRERTADLCWAGFALEVGPLAKGIGRVDVRYTVRIDHGGEA